MTDVRNTTDGLMDTINRTGFQEAAKSRVLESSLVFQL